MKYLLPVLLLFGCSKPPGEKQFFVAFSQCNNAEPYRAAQNALMIGKYIQRITATAQTAVL